MCKIIYLKKIKAILKNQNPLTVEPMNVYVRNTPIAVCRNILLPVFTMLSTKLRQLLPVMLPKEIACRQSAHSF